MKHEIDDTKTIRFWAGDLPTLLEDVARFLRENKNPSAIWSVEINPTHGACTVLNNEWMALLTYFFTDPVWDELFDEFEGED